MRGWGLFFFLLFLLLIFASVGYIAFTQYRARRAGLPPPHWKSYVPFLSSPSSSSSNYPSPRTANPLEWIKDKFAGLRNKRTARGAYEETGAGGGGGGAGAAEQGYAGGGRGRGARAEDDAWDSRMGRDHDGDIGIDDHAAGGAGGYAGPGGYYEEESLGLAPTPGLGAPEPYSSNAQTEYLGANTSYEPQRGRSKSPSGSNPFGDHHESGSLRDVSPRPVKEQGHLRGQDSLSSAPPKEGDSPTSRRSMFREGL